MAKMQLTAEPGRGVMFHVREKRNDRAPDLEGVCNLDGKLVRIAAWERTSKTGTAFLSLSVKWEE